MSKKRSTCKVCHKRGQTEEHHHWWPKAEVMSMFVKGQANKMRSRKWRVCRKCHRAYHLKAVKCRRNLPDVSCYECKYAVICRYWIPPRVSHVDDS